MRKYLVKNKYTYEKKRQVCFDYTEEISGVSGNAVFGRYRYDLGEEIYSTPINCGESIEITLLDEISSKFSSSSGICVKVEGENSDGYIRVTFFDDNGHSFASSCKISDAQSANGVSFYLTGMQFTPKRMLVDATAECECYANIRFVNILNYLSEWGGQAHFYTASGCEI